MCYIFADNFIMDNKDNSKLDKMCSIYKRNMITKRERKPPSQSV